MEILVPSHVGIPNPTPHSGGFSSISQVFVENGLKVLSLRADVLPLHNQLLIYAKNYEL